MINRLYYLISFQCCQKYAIYIFEPNLQVYLHQIPLFENKTKEHKIDTFSPYFTNSLYIFLNVISKNNINPIKKVTLS